MNTITVRTITQGVVSDETIKVNWKGKYLAVHRGIDKHNPGKVDPKAGYVITHIATGLYIRQHMEKLSTARGVAVVHRYPALTHRTHPALTHRVSSTI